MGQQPPVGAPGDKASISVKDRIYGIIINSATRIIVSSWSLLELFTPIAVVVWYDGVWTHRKLDGGGAAQKKLKSGNKFNWVNYNCIHLLIYRSEVPCHGYKDILDISPAFRTCAAVPPPLHTSCLCAAHLGNLHSENYTWAINSVGTGSVCQDLELKFSASLNYSQLTRSLFSDPQPL